MTTPTEDARLAVLIDADNAGAQHFERLLAEIAYVGDECDIDAVAASDAGMVRIWLDRPGGHPVDDPDPSNTRISSLAHLAGVLGSI